MEEKLNVASRWLTALAVILIPLTVIALVSSVWGLNYQFDTNQWTRYLLFASWITLAISAIIGMTNLISPPELESEKAPAKVKEKSPAPVSEGEEGEDGEEAGQVEVKKAKPAFNAAYAFTLAQACFFSLGIILYVAFISWMLLGLQAYPASTGF
ncbi:MAG: hypothetical protein AB1384_00770 [Actinomycetota bacterium]